MERSDLTTKENILRFINHTSIFSGIGIHEQHMLIERCTIVKRDKDEIIIEQGDIGDTLYIILEGKVIISKKNLSKGWIRINTLGPGDVFGEIAILRNVRRTARVTTETPCKFLTINAKNFLEIYQYFPPKSRNNIQLIIEKRLAALAFRNE